MIYGASAMAVAQANQIVTPEEFLYLQDTNGYELEEGRLVEKKGSALSSCVSANCTAALGQHCDDRSLGLVLSSGATYQCFPDRPNTVRRPDFSFIAPRRLPYAQFVWGHARIPPDLAGEVLAPGDLCLEVSERVWQYIRAGVRLVWVINPQDHTVLIYRADRSITGLNEGQELTGEDVVPGFCCRVRDLFPRPELLAHFLAVPATEEP